MKTSTLATLLISLFILGIAPSGNAQVPADRSVNQGNGRVNLHIFNKSGKVLKLVWMDWNGQAKPMGDLAAAPNKWTAMPTSPGHLFRVLNGNQVVATYRATNQQNQTFTIKPPAQQANIPAGRTQQANIPAGYAQKINMTLGRGYDAVKAAYLDPTKIRRPIFEIQPANYNYVNVGGSARFKDDFHRSTSEYSKKLGGGASVGVNYGLFSGEMEMNASSSTTGSTDRSYYNLFEVRTFFSASLHTRTLNFATGQSRAPTARVLPAALQHLNTLSPNDVIHNYGTHYLAGLGYGGTALFTRSETASRHSTAQQMEMKVKASYGAVSGSANINNSSSNTDTSENVKTTFRVVGGNVGNAINNLNIQSQMANAKQAYSQWTRSTGTRPGLSEFLSDGLLPIWTVPGLHPNRARALKTAVEAYAKQAASPQSNSKPRKVLPYSATVTLQQYDATTEKTDPDVFIGAPDNTYPRLQRTPARIKLSKGSFAPWAYGLTLAEIDRQKGQRLAAFSHFKNLPAKDLKAMAELRNGDTIKIEYNNRELYVGRNSDSAYWTAPGSGSQYEWKVWIKGVAGNINQAVMEGDLVAFESVGYRNQYLQKDNGTYMDAIDAAEEQSQGAGNGKLRYFKVSLK